MHNKWKANNQPIVGDIHAKNEEKIPEISTMSPTPSCSLRLCGNLSLLSFPLNKRDNSKKVGWLGVFLSRKSKSFMEISDETLKKPTNIFDFENNSFCNTFPLIVPSIWIKIKRLNNRQNNNKYLARNKNQKKLEETETQKTKTIGRASGDARSVQSYCPTSLTSTRRIEEGRQWNYDTQVVCTNWSIKLVSLIHVFIMNIEINIQWNFATLQFT